MKKIVFFLISFISIYSCAPQNKVVQHKEKSEMKPVKNEDGEWQLDVLDSQYEFYLNAVAKPISQYSESSLKNRNIFLVTEWNSYYFTGKYSNIIESSIDYDSRENYGIKFEYRLYQVFAYVQWKYGLRLNGLSQADVR